MNHLQLLNQTYVEHFKDSIEYGLLSWKASLFFFIHAFFPNIFTSHGSRTINYVHQLILNKSKSDSECYV